MLKVGSQFHILDHQIKGCYVRPEGRYPQFIVPGWYRVEKIEGIEVTLRSTRTDVEIDPFVCTVERIKAVIDV